MAETPARVAAPSRTYRYYDLVMAAFVTVLLCANLIGASKVASIGGFVFGAGVLLFPISYVFGDILTEVYGYRRTRRVICSGFGAAAAMSALLWLVAVLPGEATWQSSAGDAAYGAILGSVSSGAIVLASLIAYLGGEFSNSYVLAKLKVRMRGRRLWICAPSAAPWWGKRWTPACSFSWPARWACSPGRSHSR